MLPTKIKDKLEKMQYAIVGEHSAVQVCMWTKKAIKGDRGCWKEKFYGISSAGCCQMSPSVMWCENQCLHCWRPIEMNLGDRLKSKEDPVEILDGIVEARKTLLMGFKGNKDVDQEKLKKAMVPSLYTMSLSGEPTLYPKIGEMFTEIRKRGAVSFLVTNGLNPKVIKKLKANQLPTQITISTNAPNEKLFLQWHRTTRRKPWKTFLKTLDVINGLEGKVRRVIRLTVVKKGKGETPKFNDVTNMDDSNVTEYAELIRRANPDFIHVKGYKSVGYARERLGYDKQPWFKEVEVFAKKLEKELKDDDYEIAAKDLRSCVVMIAKKGKKLKITKP